MVVTDGGVGAESVKELLVSIKVSERDGEVATILTLALYPPLGQPDGDVQFPL